MASAKLLATLALVAMVCLQVSPTAMGARSLLADDPEWPCCRQYDTPPAAEETTLDVQQNFPEFLGRKRSPPPSSTSDQAPAPAPYHTIHNEAVASEDTAEPEWPCCRQYDEPPVAENLN